MGLSALASLHFLHPAWLTLLPLLVILTIWLARSTLRDGNWSRVIDPQLLSLLQGADGHRGTSLWWLTGSLWALSVIALSGPAWHRVSLPAYASQAAWVLVFDLSPSMAKADVSPDRATRARYAAADLLSATHGARVGLVAFAGEAHAVAPLTTDVATIRTLLEPLSPKLMPEQGDNLTPALIEAQRLLKAAYAPQGQVVILSDGFADPAAAFAQARRLRESGTTVNVVGIGKQSTDELQRVAAAGGGMYISLHDLPALIQRIRSQAGAGFHDVGSDSRGELLQWRNEGIWLLIPILVLGIALARRGWV